MPHLARPDGRPLSLHAANGPNWNSQPVSGILHFTGEERPPCPEWLLCSSTGGLDHVIMSDQPTRAPEHGEIRVRLHVSSLNYHDYAVVSGMWGPKMPRIPMGDARAKWWKWAPT